MVAKLRQLFRQSSQWQPHHVEVAAFNPRNKSPSPPLDGISASLIERLTGSEVLLNVVGGQSRKMYLRRLDEAASLRIRQPDQRHASDDRVRHPRKRLQHLSS